MPVPERLRTALAAFCFLFVAILADVVFDEGPPDHQVATPALAAEGSPQRDLQLKTARFVSYWEGYAPRCDDSVDGFATIGYGHLLHYSACTPDDQQLFWSREKALQQLDEDLQQASDDVRDLVDADLTPEMRSALISFTFNVGPVALRDSTLLRYLNQGHYRRAAAEFSRWIHGPGAEVLPGLIRRREFERRLFLTGLG